MRKMFVIRVSFPKKMLRFGLAGVEQWVLEKEHMSKQEGGRLELQMQHTCDSFP
jgi:hypothetical protein